MPVKTCEYEWYLPILGMTHKKSSTDTASCPFSSDGRMPALLIHKPDSWIPESLSGVEETTKQENPCWTSTWGRNRLLLHLNSNTLGLISVSYAIVLVIFDCSLIHTQTFCALLCTQTSYLYQLHPLDSFSFQLLVDFNQQDSPATT